MIIVRPDQLEEFANRLSTDVSLRAGERNAIKTYVLANLVGLTNEQLVVALAMPSVKPNPIPRGTVEVRTREEALHKLVRLGIITQEQRIAAETETIPDPNWQPFIIEPSPLEVLGFGEGAVISLTEVEKVMA
jgi:hypothetical protein